MKLKPRPCIIGLDEPESAEITARTNIRILSHETLPKIFVKDGELFVEDRSGFAYYPISKVVYHGIYENDHDLISGLALWNGPCVPNPHAMMDCRLKLPCLVRALRFSQFSQPARGYVSADTEYPANDERVAKWGNWHCGENKERFNQNWRSENSSIVEKFLDGSADRIVIIGEKAWQIQLEGDSWLKSIHHPTANFMDINPTLLQDSQNIAKGFGLEILANDYIISNEGEPHLLEVNHIPNVTRFPEIWSAYSDYIVNWLRNE